MNTRKSLYDIKSFYDRKAVLKASYEGMRYRVGQVEEAGEKYLQISVWPEPFCFEKTVEGKIQTRLFSYTEEGLDDGYQWLCERYEAEKEHWEYARDFPLKE